MAAGEWWSDKLNPRGLSQGDVVNGVPISSPLAPIKYLSRNGWPRQGKTYYPEVDALEEYRTDPTGWIVSRGVIARALVVSNSCELDDKNDTTRVLMAPIYPLSVVQKEEKRAAILGMERRAFMPLPFIDGEDFYADLRVITYLDRKLVSDANRFLSMTNEAVVRLQSQLIAYFTRYDPVGLEDKLLARVQADNAPIVKSKNV